MQTLALALLPWSSSRHKYELAGLIQGAPSAQNKIKAGQNQSWYQVRRNGKCESPPPLYYRGHCASRLPELSQ